MTVAEIGSGWGSLAIYLARFTGARVTAINVSPSQISVARERAQTAGVGEQVEFLEVDYRKLAGRFDRVVSIGMMEHVGIGHFGEYFNKIGELLTDDGYALVHGIGRMSPPGTTGPFIRKHIFPGVYTRSLSEVFAATEHAGLWVADVEVLRRHCECQPLAAVFGLGQRLVRRYFDHRQGSRVSIWRIGWSAMRLRTSAR